MKIYIFISIVMAMMKRLHCISSLNVSLNGDWDAYKSLYKKTYGRLDDVRRRAIFERNLKDIKLHNIRFDLGHHSYSKGVNQFTDKTKEELQAMYLNPFSLRSERNVALYMSSLNSGPLPDTVDWRTKGFVSPVQDQGNCNSCWAFSAIGALEGQNFRKTKKLRILSTQQLVDCSADFGNSGCSGGFQEKAFKYVNKFGIESESLYPYRERDGDCKYDRNKTVATCTGTVFITEDNENDLANAVAHEGPISVIIYAKKNFYEYKNGIYDDPTCGKGLLNHAVLVVGYGSENGKNYWLVKNSFGTSWGMNGYIKMAKDKNNQCAIATAASYPKI